VICLLPITEPSSEDAGDGQARVRMRRHVGTSHHHLRTWLFFAVSAVVGLLFIGWHDPSASEEYVRAVRALTSAITRDPVTVDGYVARLHPATQLFGVGYVIGLSLVVRATPARRLVMLSHGALYLALSILVQALMVVGAVATGWPIAPFGVESTLANLLVGGLVVQRLTFTSFVLPRATTIPIERPRFLWDSVLAVAGLVAVITALVGGFAFLSQTGEASSEWQVLIPLYSGSILFGLLAAPLWLLWWSNPRRPAPGEDRPPVDVIIPSYNEADNIARCLRSVEIAAQRYGGPVHVIVSDDGSQDATAQIAERELRDFEHAGGRVLTAPNGGQALALNRGMSITDAEIIVRIDADCVMGPDALHYSLPWFAEATVGCVGAMQEPRTDTVSWFHRLRTLETLFQFRFLRLGQSLVDGITCVPGTFVAFRRAPVAAAGGIVMGCNGEDCDMTMQIGRAGYRVIIDPRIRSYEDVPPTVGEFLEQRTRWSRAGVHVDARHSPLRSGLAGPRVWFWTVRRGFSWFSLQAGLVAPVFLIELAILNPTYRANLITVALLWAAGGAVPLLVALPLAVKYGHWRSIVWMPTWFAFAFLRRVAILEAYISMPTRPVRVPVGAPRWSPVRRAAATTATAGAPR
jgi:cellulose synthase/poly-beta-1,6-N-acetylglucosamine synthase-like glycosyltransferase